ncbi:VWA domain-containing protein [Paenibacillus sp. GCM10027626]|uniref:VWA domain-containing protein n=1 Tax=Paenibacillus sp. GCM10027626 TaxID=3273411 RepID=UPI00362C59F3
MQRKINVLLLLFSLIGGAIGFAVGEVMLGALLGNWPRFIVVGLYFGVLALCIGLSCLIAEMIVPRLNGSSWRQRYSGLSWKLLVPATLVLLFVVGGLLQLIYGLHFSGAKQVKDIVLVIDNSGSMLENDPDNERYTAAKQLINNMDSGKQVAVVVFSSTAELLQPFVSLSTQAKKSVNAAIDALEPTDGGTDFSLALAETMKSIEGRKNADRGTMVMLLSDGFSESDINQQIAAYKEKQIAVNTVGLSVADAKGSALLKQIADSTGGSYYDVSEASGLTLVFQNIYDKLDSRTLLTERTDAIADSTFYMLLRILSLGIIGIAVGVSLGLLFDNRFLAVSFGAGGIVGGLLAGYILDNGLSGHAFTDGVSRFVAALVLAAIIGLFTLIVPISENNGTKPRGGGRKGSSRDIPAAGMGGRTKDSRSHGF